MKGVAVAAIAAIGAVAFYTSVSEKIPESRLTDVPRRMDPTSRNRKWVPADHVVTIEDARSVKKIDAAHQPCTVWLKLPPGERYMVVRSGGSAGVRNVAYHELDDATWSAFEVYRSGDFKVTVKDGTGKYLGSFSFKVTNVERERSA